jgi:hypothetical protein
MDAKSHTKFSIVNLICFVITLLIGIAVAMAGGK